MLTLHNICTWAGTNTAQRNYIEGNKIVNAGHLIFCGKKAGRPDESVHILAKCMALSKMRGVPHQILGEISTIGDVMSMECSCKAGLGEKCKHILATLLHCSR